ncbi:hypothetical protein LOAG_15507, partial [Loa loa]
MSPNNDNNNINDYNVINSYTILYHNESLKWKGKKNFIELALLEWSSGIRIFSCTDVPLEIFVEPFKQALIRSLNKFCRNATACRLVKSVFNTQTCVEALHMFPLAVECFGGYVGSLGVWVREEQEESKALILIGL